MDSSRQVIYIPGVVVLDDEATLAGRAFRELRDGILSGSLAPGARLHIEVLARDLSMSPMPVREAIRRLDALGLVEQVPHRGARVSDVSVDDLREVYQARFAVEALAVKLAVERWADTTAERAAASLSRTVQAERENDFAGSWAADYDFHFALYGAAGSPWLVRLITPLWETSERYRRLAQSPSRDFSERYTEHMSILDACILRDPDLAAKRLCDHLSRSANLVAIALTGKPLFSEDALRSLALPLPL
jgi:DNA-binding GntR family transcriptional regulator